MPLGGYPIILKLLFLTIKIQKELIQNALHVYESMSISQFIIHHS
jgi:hypothetical protein